MEYGCLIAKQHCAEITGLAVLDIWGIEDTIGPTPYPGLYHAIKMQISHKKDTHAHKQELLHKFEQKCRQEGVACQQSEHQGIPSKHILNKSMFHDLIIIGFHTHFDFEVGQRPGRSLEKILDHAVTPILAVPDTFHWKEETIKTLIAFNGSLPAARALQRFAELARGADYEI